MDDSNQISRKSTGDPAKILMVDDRPDKLLALEAVLSDLNQELIIANSGAEALRLVLLHDFAVILMDVSMPVMDGFETASLIRQRRKNQNTPIIFITGHNANEIHMERSYALGAVDYIYAPVIPDILRAKVAVFVDLFNQHRSLRQQSESLRLAAERRAERLETRLEGLLNRLNVGVYRCLQDGKLISVNPAFLRIYGIDPQVDPQTLNLSQFFSSESDGVELNKALQQEGRVQEWHMRHLRMDLTPIWVSMSQSLVHDGDGTFIDGLVEDITSRKEGETALILKAEELARSNAELEEFAYIASHDLQEPLRMISSYASLMNDRYGPQLDERGRSFLAIQTESAQRMQLLIRDILSFSRLGKEAERVRVSLDEVLDRVLFNLVSAIEEANVDIRRGELPVVRGDAVLITQVLQNLLCNAIKFRRRDTQCVITIKAEKKDKWWEISVADNGIGIPPECLKRIFEVFQRLHSREEYTGTGIGLSICRKAVRQHGGDITVESELGRGSVFRFTLPAFEERTESRTVVGK